MAMAWLSKLVVVAAIVLAGTGSTDHSPDRVHPAASVRASNAVVRDRGLLLHDKSVAHHPNFRAPKWRRYCPITISRWTPETGRGAGELWRRTPVQ